MGTSSDSAELVYQINKFAELFRAMSDSPKKGLQGLWGELLVIERATAPKHLLDYWHNDPNDKFDFNAGKQKIEVKTSANFERIHFFSAEQLYSADGDFILIASIFLKQSSLGLTIVQLCDLIKERIGFDIELMEKINSIIFHTLGSSLEHSLSVRYDYQIAAESLCYYNQKEIVHLSLKDIPKEISHVKYRSDLSDIPMFVRNPEDDYGLLINSCFD